MEYYQLAISLLPLAAVLATFIWSLTGKQYVAVPSSEQDFAESNYSDSTIKLIKSSIFEAKIWKIICIVLVLAIVSIHVFLGISSHAVQSEILVNIAFALSWTCLTIVIANKLLLDFRVNDFASRLEINLGPSNVHILCCINFISQSIIFAPATLIIDIKYLFLSVITILLLIAVQMVKNYSRFETRLITKDSSAKELNSSLWYRLSFSWFDDIVRIGSHRPLFREDIDDLIHDDQTDVICKGFRKLATKGNSLLWDLCRFNKILIAWQALSTLFSTLVSFTGPYFLQKILLYVENPSSSSSMQAVGYSSMIFIIAVGRAFADGQTYFLGRRIGIRGRAVIIDLIYRKSLRKTSKVSQGCKESGDAHADTGKIVNLMSVDATKILEVSCYFFYLWSAPLQVIICVTFLLSVAGYPGLAGLSVMIAMMPIGGIMGRAIARFQRDLMRKTDDRITSINELLLSIRIVKFFAWEDKFEEKIGELRSAELDCLWKYILANSGSRVIWNAAPVLVSFVTFTAMTVGAGSVLTASTAFTALAIFNSLRSPLAVMPDIIVKVGDALVSLSRIEMFLAEKELDEYIVSTNAPATQSDIAVQFKDSSFSWPGSGSEQCSSVRTSLALRKIMVEFPKGKLSVISGPTGSGKSSLLAAILGELVCVSGGGKVNFNGDTKSIAYSSQEAWLQNANIRDNIIFGSHYDSRRYIDTLQACALLRDLENMEAGDLTEIGEKGINLSGGQKARISLARAIYSSSSLVLLDDPLSAVDAPTANHLFNNAICGPLARNRTIVLVTHAASLCNSQADVIFSVSRGYVTKDERGVGPKPVLTEQPKLNSLDLPKASVQSSLIQKESRFEGSVSFHVYWVYAKNAGGVLFLFLLFLTYSVCQFNMIADDLWLKVWADAYNLEMIMKISGLAHPVNVSFYIWVYAALTVMTLITFFTRVFVVAYGSLAASKKLHAAVITKILRSPIRFFETTPVGRILNRISKDMKDIDTDVAGYAGDFFANLIRATAFLLVILVVTPTSIIGIFPIGIVYVLIANQYVRTARELKRMDSITRSPIFSHFGETLSGATTIRAYACKKRFITELHKRVDTNHQVFAMLWVANRWLGIRIDLFGALVTLSAGLAVIYNVVYGQGMNAGAAGLSITYALSFTDALLWLVRQHALMEMEMNSVERIEEYLVLPEEAPAICEYRPPTDWPRDGKIDVRNLSMRYSPESELVLSNVSFQIQAGEKLGIVGRTGAGKSSLSLAFFRFTEHESGQILVDGIDISKIGLHDLRSRLTIIPQDPYMLSNISVLFSGTLRSNLDPHSEFSDEFMWKSLKSSGFFDNVQMTRSREGSATSEIKGGAVNDKLSLESAVEEGGKNFSQGQRQLLCLSRALLRQCKIIVLDEATASVDYDTDTRIQITMRKEFIGSTLLCIAHRLRTIIDYDKILVLEKGRVAQFGSPKDLIGREGIFQKMCQESGEFNELVEMAACNM